MTSVPSMGPFVSRDTPFPPVEVLLAAPPSIYPQSQPRNLGVSK
jgi:hypothetical protein